MKKLRFLSAIFFAVLFSITAFGDHDVIARARKRVEKPMPANCFQLDLLDKNSDQRWNSSVLQRGTNWCSAYAVSDALSHNLGTSISSIFTAIVSTQRAGKGKSRPPGDFFYGLTHNLNVCSVVSSVNERGYCDFSKMEGKGFEASTAWLLSAFYNQAQGNKTPAVSLGEVLTKSVMAHKFQDSQQQEVYLRLLLQGGNPRPMDRAEDLLAAVSKQFCHDPKPISKAQSCSYFVPYPGGDLTAEIDSQMEHRRMPVLTFNEKLIYTEAEIVPAIAPHAVTISARRWNKNRNRCEYRIRTSANVTDCKHHTSAVTCADDELKRGMIWIGAGVINGSSIGNIAIIKDK